MKSGSALCQIYCNDLGRQKLAPVEVDTCFRRSFWAENKMVLTLQAAVDLDIPWLLSSHRAGRLLNAGDAPAADGDAS